MESWSVGDGGRRKKKVSFFFLFFGVVFSKKQNFLFSFSFSFLSYLAKRPRVDELDRLEVGLARVEDLLDLDGPLQVVLELLLELWRVLDFGVGEKNVEGGGERGEQEREAARVRRRAEAAAAPSMEASPKPRIARQDG